MAADAPTILATSGGLREGRRTRWEFSELTDYAVELAGTTGRAPRVCFLATAWGDQPAGILSLYEAAQQRGFSPSHLSLIPMPNVDDIDGHLLGQDVIWVGGGSVAALLAMWRLHGVDSALRSAWQAGVVLTGVSAGSICWHVGGTTDSFGPDLRPVTDGLGFILGPGYATDDGAGIVYRGTEFVEAVTETDDAGAYFVDPTGETRLGGRRL